MLKIDNREEIKQYLLKETGSPKATEGILAFLENQECLSPVYDIYEKYNNKHYVFKKFHPHSLEEIENEYESVANIYDNQHGGGLGHSDWGALGGFSFPDFVEQIAAIITVGDFAFKLYKENKGTINSFIQTNTSKEIIESKLKELLTKAMMKVKIKETREEDENINETVKDS